MADSGKCAFCEGQLELRPQTLEFRIGNIKAEDTKTRELLTCVKCGEWIIGQPELAEAELTAVTTVFQKAESVDAGAVRFARKVLGLTIEEFAKEFSISKDDVIELESGARPVTPLMRRAIFFLLVIIWMTMEREKLESAAYDAIVHDFCRD